MIKSQIIGLRIGFKTTLIDLIDFYGFHNRKVGKKEQKFVRKDDFGLARLSSWLTAIVFLLLTIHFIFLVIQTRKKLEIQSFFHENGHFQIRIGEISLKSEVFHIIIRISLFKHTVYT